MEKKERIVLQFQQKSIFLQKINICDIVVIHSCNAAKGSNSFAEQLSKRLSEKMLNVSVVAPPNVLYGQTVTERLPNGNTKSIYTETVVGSTGYKSGPDAGSWDIFTAGRQTKGEKTFQATLKRIH